MEVCVNIESTKPTHLFTNTIIVKGHDRSYQVIVREIGPSQLGEEEDLDIILNSQDGEISKGGEGGLEDSPEKAEDTNMQLGIERERNHLTSSSDDIDTTYNGSLGVNTPEYDELNSVCQKSINIMEDNTSYGHIPELKHWMKWIVCKTPLGRFLLV